MMENHQLYFDANRTLWDEKTKVHKDSEFYALEKFRKGQTSLQQIELKELGNVKGRSLLHLQCHFGMDSLSWAREGAIVTGVDFSEEAVITARELAVEEGSDAEFICCNVYDLKEYLDKKFDIVFTSYGTIGWLPDLDKWAELVAYYLKPGGTFYMVDFHPIVWMFNSDFSRVKYPYHNAAVIEEESIGTYTDCNAPIHATEYGWNHSLSEIINSLIRYGLQIEFLNEFPYSSFNVFNDMVQGDDGLWRLRDQYEMFPLMYSIRAKR
jgi:ubiquinone/menaquinone biosynthesis C-methylase UbiE